MSCPLVGGAIPLCRVMNQVGSPSLQPPELAMEGLVEVARVKSTLEGLTDPFRSLLTLEVVGDRGIRTW